MGPVLVGTQGPVTDYHMKINGERWDNSLRNLGDGACRAAEAGWGCWASKKQKMSPARVPEPISDSILTPRSTLFST